MIPKNFSLKTVLFVITFTILLACLVVNLSAVWSAVGNVFALFAPVTVGLVLAFILNVPMRPLEEKVFRFMEKSRFRFVRKLRRPVCLLLAIVLVVSIITLLILVVLPELQDTVIALAAKLPKYFNDLKAWIFDLLNRFDMDTGWLQEFTIDWKLLTDTLMSFLDSEEVTSGVSNVVGTGVSWVGTIGGSLVNLVFSFVIAVYFLAQKEKICRFIKRTVSAFTPARIAERMFYVAALSNNIFSSFIRSQCTEAVILGLLSYIGMLIFGFEYAGIISIVIGFTALVPIVGALVGEVFGAILLLTVSPLRAILFLVFILTLQQLEGSLIYPRVVGTSVGLPGIIVFSAVLIGGNAFGIPGALFAVPVCAVLYTLLKEAVAKKEAAAVSPEETK